MYTTFSTNQVHQYRNDQNTQKLDMSDLKFGPIHENFRVTVSSIENAKNTNLDTIALNVYDHSLYKINLPLGLLGYCETNTAHKKRSISSEKHLKVTGYLPINNP